jgi:hypothetical protein
MGKGKTSKKPKDTSTAATCAACKNFKPGTKGTGRCVRKDKKRSAADKGCGDFKARS